MIDEKNKEIPRISKQEFDNLCPRCRSSLITKTGAHGEGATLGPDLPGAYIETWRCETCKKFFELF